VPSSSLFSKALPDLGDETDLSIAAERRLGDSIVRSLYRDPDYLDDPVLTDYVQSIWQPLLRSARARGDLRADMQEVFAWEILVSKERDVNAFALPGGYFGLYLGLVGMVQTRDELASVLGHEMSHVTQRHIARRMSKESAQTPWMIGGMILGLLAASKSNNYNAANAAIMGSQAIAIQNSLNYSRDMAREADRTGFGVTTEAGFEAQGFVAMFEKLQQASRNNDSGGFPYLRSHPLTTERIADMQQWDGLSAHQHHLLLEMPAPYGELMAWLNQQWLENGVQSLAGLREGLRGHDNEMVVSRLIDDAPADIDSDAGELQSILAALEIEQLSLEIDSLTRRMASDPQAYERIKQLNSRLAALKKAPLV
jgi:Zn-dependent protease with chaperone function